VQNYHKLFMNAQSLHLLRNTCQLTIEERQKPAWT